MPIRPDPFAIAPVDLRLSSLLTASTQASRNNIRKEMKERKKGPYNTSWLLLRSAIIAAIKRCESVCNPAIVIRPRFTIHVRRLTERPTHSWVVTYSNNDALTGGTTQSQSEGEASAQNISAKASKDKT